MRVLVAVAVAAVLTGCGGSPRARFVAAVTPICETVPTVEALAGATITRRSGAAVAGLESAAAKLAAVKLPAGEERVAAAAFVAAVGQTVTARDALAREYAVLRTADPTATADVNSPIALVGVRLEELGDRYREARDAGRAAGVVRCGGLESAPPPAPTSPNHAEVQAPAGFSPAQRASFEHGREVTLRSGCLACHKIGDSGNEGPGPPLDGIGDRLTRAQLDRALVNPVAPMPSFKSLPAADRGALLDFLQALAP